MLLCLAFGVWLLESLARDVADVGYTTIDTRRSRLEPDGNLVDARWQAWMSGRLAEQRCASSLDPDSVRDLAQAIASLPFISEVSEPRVVWPDGFEVQVHLRAPVACIRAGEEYLTVAADATVLPGSWPAPPWIEPGFLPVIGPNDRSLDRARAGDVLREHRHVDALSVAISMREKLSRDDFEVLGPTLIDATRAREASVDEPGVVVKLENRRVILFGRAPNSGEPGELPVDMKWASLSRALLDLKSGAPGRDWSLVDVRWDVPAIQRRALEDVEPDANAGAAKEHSHGSEAGRANAHEPAGG